MKLLVLALDVNLSRQTGEAIHTGKIAGALVEAGHQVVLVTATPAGDKVNLGAPVAVKTVGPGTTWGVVRECAVLAREVRPDIIYERRLSPKISYLLSLLTSTPFAVELNGVERERDMLGHLPTSRFMSVRRRIRSVMLRRACAIVAVSEGIAREANEGFRIDPARIRVVPNGVDTRQFRPMDRVAAIRELNLPAGQHVLFVGNLVPWQGLLTMMKAFPAILARHPRARFTIVGDGAQRQELEATCRELDLAGHVAFMGSVPHSKVPTFVAASSICVAPFTRVRNQDIGLSPLKLYEYAAGGRAIVASAVPGVEDFLISSGGGVAVPPDSPTALEQAVGRLLGDPGEAEHMGELGHRYVHAHFSWSRSAHLIERALMGCPHSLSHRRIQGSKMDSGSVR